MKYEFIQKRSTQLSDKAIALRDQLANLQYEVGRQAPYNEGFSEIDRILQKAKISIKIAVDELDAAAQLANKFCNSPTTTQC